MLAWLTVLAASESWMSWLCKTHSMWLLYDPFLSQLRCKIF